VVLVFNGYGERPGIARAHAQNGYIRSHEIRKYQDTPPLEERAHFYEYVHDKLSHEKIRTRKLFVEHYTGFFAFLTSCCDTPPDNPRGFFFKIFATSNRPVSQAGQSGQKMQDE
jgi:hypothetical protein